MFDRLFTPLILGRAVLPNRICFLAHRTNFAKRGLLNTRHIAYYQRRAQGGCGLIIVGEISIHPGDRPWEPMIEAYHSGVVKYFRKLTHALHEFETPVFAQLNHHGFQSSGAISRQPVWGPSAESDVVFGETAKTMEVEDIEEITGAFARCAAWVKEGGFDGLEIDMGPESLLRQFLSPLSNHRQDPYGGSLENRMRLPLEVIEAVRKAVGQDLTVGIRLCADERFWGGIPMEESIESAKSLERTGGIDFINVSIGTYYNLYLSSASMHTPLGFSVEEAWKIKEAVSLPVISGYQIMSPKMANDILVDGKADMIGFVRPLICDPDFSRKAREGRPKDIRYCVRDNKGCIGRINQFKTLGCIQNPQVGYEPLSGEESHHRASRRKRVIVVGAGPAGLEAGRAVGQRGHDVIVYEREEVVGGQINLITKRPGRKAMAGVVRYLMHMLGRLRVPVITGVEVTPEMILEKGPDAVVVATGSRPKEHPIPGEYGPPSALNVEEVLKGRFPVGERVLFIDENGGHRATATAELLADQGKKVTMVTSDLYIGVDLGPLGDLSLSRQRLLHKGVTFRADTDVQEIQGTAVRGRDIYTNEQILLEGYDTIVLDLGNVVEDHLYRQLKGRIKEVWRVGDCVAPRGIDMAVLEGRRVGETL